MREILFRGKRKDNGEWVYGGFYHGILSETDSPFSLDNARIKTIIIQEGTYYHVIPETIGQYTGKKDKNGTKIFEGDICEFRSFNCRRVGVVLFNKEKYRYELLQSGDIDWSLEIHEAFDLEVIGNIHDREKAEQ